MARQLTGNIYLDRLSKLVPIEFISVYLAVSQSVQNELSLRQPVLLVVVLTFIILIPLYLYKVHKVNNHLQVAMTTAAFVIWTYTLGDAFEPGVWIQSNFHHPTIASVAMLVWTGIVPVFINPKE